MVNDSNIFGLLLMALDEKKSAEEINQQLESPKFKEALNEIKAKLNIDEESFKTIEKQLKGLKVEAKDFRKELELASKLWETMAISNANKLEKDSTQEMLQYAKQQLPEADFKITEKNIDSMTGATQSLVLAFSDANGQMHKVKVTADELSDSGFSMGSIKMVQSMEKQIKDYGAELKKVTKDTEGLYTIEGKSGVTPETTADLEKLRQNTEKMKADMTATIQAAEQAGTITAKQAELYYQQVDKAHSDMIAKTEKFQQKSADTNQFKQGQENIKIYKKEYEELINLEIKQATQAGDFTAADEDRLNYLKQHTKELENSVSTMPKLTEQVKELKKAQETKIELKLGKAEVIQAKKDIKDLEKTYKDLNSVQKKIDTAGLSSGNEELIETYKKQKEEILGNIKAKEENLKTSKFTLSAEQEVQKGLQEIAEKQTRVEEEQTAKMKVEYAKKEEYLNSFAGTFYKQSSGLNFDKMGDSLSRTDPQLQKFAESLHGQNAVIHSVKNETDKYNNSYLKVMVTQDKTADVLDHVTYMVDKNTGALRRQTKVITQNVSRSMNFVTQMGHAIRKMSIWGAAARVLYGSMRELEQGFEFIKELDKDITQAAIVTGKQRSEVQGLANDYADLAVEMGKTVDQISQVNTELLRQGLTIQEAGDRLETIIKLSATGQITTEESLRVVTTAVNAMKESHIRATDIILRASNISASSVEELGEAFTKSASSAYAAGMEMEQATAILATMLEVTQEGPSQLGTSLKTILARFNRVNEETGEFNTELNKVQGAIESVGVTFTNTDGQIRNTYNILDDLSDIWPTLTKNQQAYIATTSAGVRMQNRFFAVMNNFDRVKTITEETEKAAGSINKAYTTYLDSVEAASNRAQASLQRLWINTISSDNISKLYNLSTAIINLIDNIGVLNLAIMGIVLHFTKTTGVISGLALGMIELRNATLAETIAKEGLTTVLWKNIVAQWAQVAADKAALTVGTAHVKMLPLLIARMKAVAAVTWTTVAPYLSVVAGFVAAGLAIAGLIKGYKRYQEVQKEAREEVIKSNNVFLDQHKNYDLTIMQLEEMQEKYQSYLNIINTRGGSAASALGTEKYKEFITLQDEMLNLFPELTTKTNIYGDTIIDLSSSVGSATEQFKELHEEEKKLFQENIRKEYENTVEVLEEYLEVLRRVAEAEKNRGTISFQGESYTVPTVGREEEEESLAAYRKATETSLAQFVVANEDALNDIEKLYLNNPLILDGLIQWQIANPEEAKGYDEFEKYIKEQIKTIEEIFSEDLQDDYFELLSEQRDENEKYEKGDLSGLEYQERIKKIKDSVFELFAEIKKGKELTKEQEVLFNELENQIIDSEIAIESLGVSYEEFYGKMEATKEKMETLLDAETELQENGKLSSETLFKLSEAYGAETIAIQVANGTLDAFLNSQKKAVIIDEQNTIDRLEESKKRIKGLLAEAEVYNNLFDLYDELKGVEGQIAIAKQHIKDLEEMMSGDKGTSEDKGTDVDKVEMLLGAYEKLEGQLKLVANEQAMLNIEEEKFLEDDYQNKILISQKRISLFETEQKLQKDLLELKKEELGVDRDLLKEVGMLNDEYQLVDDYNDILNEINSGAWNHKYTIEQIEEAYENWSTLALDEIPQIEQNIKSLDNSIQQNVTSIYEMAKAFSQANYEAYQASEIATYKPLVDNLKEGIEENQEIIDQEKEKQDILTETYNAEKEILEDKKKALDEIAEQEDKEKERAELLLAIEEKRELLNKAKARRSLQVLNEEGQFDWVADPREIAKQQEELDEALEDFADFELEREREAAKAEIDLEIDKLTTLHEANMKFHQDKIDEAEESQRRQENSLKIFNKRLEAAQELTYEKWIEKDKEQRDNLGKTSEEFLIEMEGLYGQGFANLVEEVLKLAESYGSTTDEVLALMEAMKDLAKMGGVDIETSTDRTPTSSSSTNPTRSSSSESSVLANKDAGFDKDYSQMYFDAKAKGDAAGMAAANAAANAKRNLGYVVTAVNDIKAVDPNFEFADGGEIKSTGTYLTKFHGTKDDPEWIFNSAQLDTTLQNAITTALKMEIPKPLESKNKQEAVQQIFKIDKLEFPAVSKAEEIREAIMNLPTIAKMKVRTS